MCKGGEEYDTERIIREIKEETEFGKSFYKQLELAYDEVIGKGASAKLEDVLSFLDKSLIYFFLKENR